MSKSNTGSTLQSVTGVRLFEQEWLVEQPKANFLLVHGLGEHCARYAETAAFFNAQGYNIYTYDHIGHGNSPGKRAYVADIDFLKDDLIQKIKLIREASPNLPLFALGHSMGGGVLAYALASGNLDIDGAILSAAALKPGDDIPAFLVKIAGFLGKVAPKLPTVQLEVTALSRDPKVIEAYEADPLVFHKKVPARTGAQIFRAMKFIQENADKIRKPILILHGTADRLTNVEGSKELNHKLGAEDKTFKLYEGFYHEIMKEPGKEQVLEDIAEWLNARVN